MSTGYLSRITTIDPFVMKRARVLKCLADERNAHLTNRAMARMLQVDEGLIRKIKKALGLSSNPVGTNQTKDKERLAEERKKAAKKVRKSKAKPKPKKTKKPTKKGKP